MCGSGDCLDGAVRRCVRVLTHLSRKTLTGRKVIQRGRNRSTRGSLASAAASMSAVEDTIWRAASKFCAADPKLRL